MIDATQMARVREAFEAARAAPDDDSRAAAIDRIAAGDLVVRAEALSLLRHAGADSMVIREGVARLAAGALDDALSADLEDAWLAEGTRVGAFTVTGRLGAGGMSLVHRAAQDEPRREVALKILRLGAWSMDARRRLRREASALARLQHPGIAQVYAAGEFTPDGAGAPAPYFAMELVEGEPITSFVEAHGLDPRRRLGLLAEVCDAVQHAHDRAVIHRDIKPGNVLVGADGRPRLLDFGVALVATEDVDATAARTSAAAIIGTLPYMAPEQIEGRADLIDARTDVYALGALAYEVLSGRRALDPPSSSILSAARWAIDTEPVRLGRLVRAARGDTEAVVTKAMEKESARRYASAAALAADLRRAIAGHAVLARRPGAMREVRLFVRRNRAFSAATAFAVLVLMLGAAIAASQAVRATAAQREASSRENAIRAAAREMLFGVHDAIESLPGALSARERLALSSQRLLESLASDASDDAQLAVELAQAYSRVGRALGIPHLANRADVDSARDAFLKAARLHRAAEESAPMDRAIRRLRWRAELELIKMSDAEASQPERLVLALQPVVDAQRRLVQESPDDAEARMHLALSLADLGDSVRRTGDVQSAEAALTEALEHGAEARRLTGDAPASIAAFGEACSVVSALAYGAQDYSRIVSLLEPFAASVTRSLSVAPGNYALRRQLRNACMDLGSSLVRVGRGDDAIASCVKALELAQDDAQTDPEDAGAHRGVMLAYSRLGEVHQVLATDAARPLEDRVNHASEALRFTALAQQMVLERVERGWLAPWEANYPETGAKTLAECERLSATLEAELRAARPTRQ